jgi:hypothetical protein
MVVGRSTVGGVGCVRQANTAFNNELLVGDPETEKYKRHKRLISGWSQIIGGQAVMAEKVIRVRQRFRSHGFWRGAELPTGMNIRWL